jgi:amidase
MSDVREDAMTRAAVPLVLLAMIVLTGCATSKAPPPAMPFTVVEAGIPDLQTALAAGRVTSRQLVMEYLARIGLYEDQVKAIITVNPKALEEAEARDRERASGRIRGPLHGIPIAIKDNIHTTDMPTTGGAVAFEGYRPPYEATIVKLLRDAGAIIIAKTVLTELANWVAGAPDPMPANYSGLAGYGLNPYDPRRDPREATNDGRPALATGGSSSGIGTTASFWAASVGTETSGSILSPANQTGLAAVKPTVGRISRYGIIPIVADQDTAGPMARTVADAAILLGVLESTVPDPYDPATRKCQAPRNRDYTPHLKRDGLKGARIGIPRAFYYDKLTLPGETAARGGLNEAQAAAMADAIEVLKREGAIIVDPVVIPSVVDPDEGSNYLRFPICAGAPQGKGADEKCTIVLKYGMKRDFNAWLRTLGPGAPVKTLAELREFNTARPKRGAIKYGQSRLDISDEIDLEADRPRYEADRAKDVELGGARGIDAALKEHQLDALLFPGGAGADIAARPGYPTVMVPVGLIAHIQTPPFPDAFQAKPTPFSVSFAGTACSEPRLLELGYGFEQASRRRVPPPATP